MASKFNIGDVVIINKSAENIFGKTTPGSVGTIESINISSTITSYLISFHYLETEGFIKPRTFTINEQYLDIVVYKLSESDKPYAKVINKIKYLDKKFKDRKQSEEWLDELFA